MLRISIGLLNADFILNKTNFGSFYLCYLLKFDLARGLPIDEIKESATRVIAKLFCPLAII